MKKWCLVILTLMLWGCSAAPKTTETEAVKYDRPVLRTETGSEEKSFTVFAMDTVMQFEIYGGNDEIEEKIRKKETVTRNLQTQTMYDKMKGHKHE